MKPLEQAYISDAEVERTIADYMRQWSGGNEIMRQAFPAADAKLAEHQMRERLYRMRSEEVIFKNDTYQVNVRSLGGDGFHLSIKRIDRKPIHDWRDLQAIKNQILGPEGEAVELYPAESRRVDTANQYHLWGSNNPNWRLPFGFNEGRLVTDDSFGKSVNRKLEESV